MCHDDIAIKGPWRLRIGLNERRLWNHFFNNALKKIFIKTLVILCSTVLLLGLGKVISSGRWYEVKYGASWEPIEAVFDFR